MIYLRKKLLLSIVSLLFVATVVFSYIQYSENKQYESYISQVLTNDVAHLSTAIVLNDYLLEDILSEGEITKKQLFSMKEKYLTIHESGRTVVDLADKWLNRIGNVEYSYNNTPFPTYMAYEFHYYLRKLEQDKLTDKETLALTSEDIQTFELMKSVNDKWVQAILENIEGTQKPSSNNIVDGNFKENSNERVTTDEYWDTYIHEIVNVEDWVNMVEQIQRESEEYEIKVDNLL